MGFLKMQRTPSDEYLADMDNNMKNKLDDIVPHIPDDAHIIIDIGFGSGLSTYRIATLFPMKEVIGIDKNMRFVKQAQDTYKANNLEYICNDIVRFMKNVSKWRSGKVVMIFSSVMHEIFSYGTGITSIEHILDTCYKNGIVGDRIIIRDFIAPSDPDDRVTLHHTTNDTNTISFQQFANDFKHFPILCATKTHNSDHIRIYKTNMRSLYEYIYRKNFVDNWEYELQEQYGFWSYDIASYLLKSSGYTIVHSSSLNNEWILQNRIIPYITIYNENGRHIPPPTYQQLFVADITISS